MFLALNIRQVSMEYQIGQHGILDRSGWNTRQVRMEYKIGQDGILDRSAWNTRQVKIESGSEEHFGVEAASFFQFGVPEHALGALELAVAFFEVDVVEDHVVALQASVLVVLLLVDDVGLFLEQVHDNLAEEFVHIFNLLVEFVLYVELLLRVFRCHYSDLHVAGYVLDSDLLFVPERVQHLRLGEAHLPFVLQYEVLLHQPVLLALPQEKFTVARCVLVVPPLLLVFLAHLLEALLCKQLGLLPLPHQIPQQALNGSFLVAPAGFLRLFDIFGVVEDPAQVTVAVQTFIVGQSELGGGVLLDEAAGVVPFVAWLAGLPNPYEGQIFLHALYDLVVLSALELECPEFGDNFDVLVVFGLEEGDVVLGDDEHKSFEEPGRLLEDQSVGADVDCAWVLILLGLEFAVVLGKDVEFYHFRFDAAAALFGLDEVSEPLVFHLEDSLGLVDLLLLDEGGEGGVEVGLGGLVDQVLVAAVLFEQEEHLVVDDHVVEDIYPVFLLLQQLVEVLERGLLHDALVQALHGCEEPLVLLPLALLQLQELFLQLVEGTPYAIFEVLQFLGIDRLVGYHLLLELQVVLKDYLRSVLEAPDGFLLVLEHLLHLDLAVAHILGDLLEGFLLPLDDVEAQV